VTAEIRAAIDGVERIIAVASHTPANDPEALRSSLEAMPTYAPGKVILRQPEAFERTPARRDELGVRNSGILQSCFFQARAFGSLSFLFFRSCACLVAFCFWSFSLFFLPPLSPIVFLLYC